MRNPTAMQHPLVNCALKLRARVAALTFTAPVSHVYNPLDYAWETHEHYLRSYGKGPKRVVFVGMNPGPFGMAQTGVPFGEVHAVRDWLGIHGAVGKPCPEHPKRPVTGFDCSRSEVSGRRLWGLFSATHGSAAAFFAEHFVANYCPLLFLQADAGGCRNYPPDKLAGTQTTELFAACDQHLRDLVAVLRPRHVVGIGAFATGRARHALAGLNLAISTVLHPSPASPAANRDWAGTATRQLRAAGVWTEPTGTSICLPPA